MHLSRYLKIFPSKDKPGYFLLFSTLRNSTVLVSGVTLSEALSGSNLGADGETLRKLGMLVDHPSVEREQMLSLIDSVNETNTKYRAVVVLNLDCNLDCDYCYEGEFRHEQYMTQETAKLLIETVIKEQIGSGKSVNITFYGGEAMLSEDMIRTISLPLQEAAKLKGVAYTFDLVTNGTLFNRAAVERLLPLGLSGAKFTLDGPREIHNRQRPFASGAGSFDIIVDNIAGVCDLIPAVLGGNFRQDNYREFPRLLDYLVEYGITPDKLARVIFTPITEKAGCAEHGSDCASSTEPWLVEALPYLRQEVIARGFVAPKVKASACIVEFDHNVVVNYDGSLYKCPAFMGYDGYSVGTLASGICDYKASHGIGNWKKDECLDCPYLPLCFGGCRFLNLLNDRPISSLDCRRDFYDATLESLISMNFTPPAKKDSPANSDAAGCSDYCI
jgi:uncharacterized protein